MGTCGPLAGKQRERQDGEKLGSRHVLFIRLIRDP